MAAPELEVDCLVQIMLASCSGPSPQLRELCKLSTINRAWRTAAHEVMATQVLSLQPSSFGPRANAVARSRPDLCLPCGALDVAASVCRCTSLERLNLSGLHLLASDELLRAVAASCRQLQELTLDYCTGVTTAGLEALAQGAPQLRSLSLRRCDGIRSVSAVGWLKELEDLDLSWVPPADAAALEGSAGCLRRLCLHGCERVGDEVCGRLPAVEELILSFTSVTDEGLALLARHSPKIITLVLAKPSFNLWQTGRWTESGLAAFEAALPRAKVVLVSC